MRITLKSLWVALIWSVLAGTGYADDVFEIRRASVNSSGRFELGIEGISSTYNRLLFARSPGDAWEPVALGIASTTNEVVLTDPIPPGRSGFYRVERIPLSAPLDSDGDGTDDVVELGSPTVMNPLNPALLLNGSDGAVIIPDRAAFESLALRDDVPGAFGVFEIKFLILDADTASPELYFMNSQNHPLHYYFARDVLGYSSGLAAFNNETYFFDSTRRNLAGSIIAHDHFNAPSTGWGPGVYTMEFWPTDPVSFPFIEKAYKMVASAMPFVDTRVLYHPNGETQQALFESQQTQFEDSRVHAIQTEVLFGNLTYSPLNPGFAYGRLKVADVGTRITVSDIVIFQSVPNDIARVAGIITEIPQTPLSHINLKAKQNGTPNAYIRDASTLPAVAPFIGQNIRIDMTADGFSIIPATQAEVDAFFESIRPAEMQIPVRDLTVTAVAALDDIGRPDADAFGSKSANVAELHHLMAEGMAPDGYAIPFSFYDEFMQSNGLYFVAGVMMADPNFMTNDVIREDMLGDFRDQIRAGALPPAMMTALGGVQSNFPADTRIRCRSSANVEDLEGFNGAGLYNSKTHKPDEGHLSHTVKQVWASNWTFRAFEEREFYRIDHLQSAMGVLCHPSYRNELANGVAVTKNLFNPGWRGYYVNVQAGESLVTNPDEGAIPDEFLISSISGFNEYEIQYVRHSNLIPEGSSVLSHMQAIELADELARVQSHFQAVYGAQGNPDFAMEVEFKITADGILAIKQARPWID